jgi:hypothetical protein
MWRSRFGSLWFARLALCGGALVPASMLAPVGCAQVAPFPKLNERDGGEDLAGFVSSGPGVDGGDAGTPPGTDLATSGDGSIGISLCDIHKLRINEVSTGGSGGATDEFVELYNPCSAAVPLTGGKLVYRAATSGSDNYTLYAFGPQSVPSHGFFLVANSGFAGSADLKPYQGGSGLAAAGGGVALKDASDAVVDSLGWGTATNAFVEGTVIGAPSTTQSAARKSDGVDTDDNAVDFKLAAPTPGATN